MIKDSNLAYLITRTTLRRSRNRDYDTGSFVGWRCVTPQSRIGHEVFRQVLPIPAVASLSLPPLPLALCHHSVDQLVIS